MELMQGARQMLAVHPVPVEKCKLRRLKLMRLVTLFLLLLFQNCNQKFDQVSANSQ